MSWFFLQNSFSRFISQNREFRENYGNLFNRKNLFFRLCVCVARFLFGVIPQTHPLNLFFQKKADKKMWTVQKKSLEANKIVKTNTKWLIKNSEHVLFLHCTTKLVKFFQILEISQEQTKTNFMLNFNNYIDSRKAKDINNIFKSFKLQAKDWGVNTKSIWNYFFSFNINNSKTY